MSLHFITFNVFRSYWSKWIIIKIYLNVECFGRYNLIVIVNIPPWKQILLHSNFNVFRSYWRQIL